jgi:SpoVK/Ycf46/Vps4 family AAA+-type ATPase
MLLTARPDLLPIDLKRQGRAEVHIPLFYPADAAQVRAMFLAMARKAHTPLAEEDIPPIPHLGQLSGADVEGIVGRAARQALLAGAAGITREALAAAVAEFLPSTQSLEKEMQEIAAILECTDRQFLPPEILEKMNAYGGREKLQERYTQLRRMIELA